MFAKGVEQPFLGRASLQFILKSYILQQLHVDIILFLLDYCDELLDVLNSLYYSCKQIQSQFIHVFVSNQDLI